MAFFKLRKGGDDQAAVASPPESVEALRKRAKHRLIGSVVLVLVAVVGFPLLVDKQPRPMAVDVSIDIPDKNKVKPLSVPAPAAAQATSATPATSASTAAPTATTSPASPAPVTAQPSAAASAVPAAAVASVVAAKALSPATPAPTSSAKSNEKPSDKAAEKVADKPVAKAADVPADKATTKANDKPGDKATEKAADKVSDKAVAKASADKDPINALAAAKAETPAAADEARFVVQVGAFGDESRARSARLKLERAGLKNYTQVADTKDGKRIRVRAGPYPTRAAADKAAQKIRKLGLPVTVLAL